MPDPDTQVLAPLADLYIHAMNTRSEPPNADIEVLADSIAELGLLQNLCGWQDPGADNSDQIGIVAGGRRLRALFLLAERDGRDPAETRVPVRLAPDQDTARIWASAENAAREALHPADEVRAYGRMAKAGADANAIARAFAVGERHVRQRLKLASLPTSVIDALRGGQISLDQAAALTSGRNSEAIEAELKKILTSKWTIGVSEIRHDLSKAAIDADDPRVKLIGLDAYRAAGGEIDEDLFIDEIRVLDETLLETLVQKEFERVSDSYLAQGFKWVKQVDRDELYKHSDGMTRIDRVPVDLPDADQAELDDLTKRRWSNDFSNDDRERLHEMEERAAGTWPDDDIAASGVFLFLDWDGQIEMIGPYREASEQPEDAQDEPPEPEKAESKALPQNLIQDLKRIRLAALQQRASGQTELMLDLLAFSIAGNLRSWHRPLGINLSEAQINPEKGEGFTRPATLPEPGNQMAEYSAELFDEFRALGKKHRNELITRHLATTLTDAREMLPQLAAMLAPNPREIWTPTAAGYFSRLPVPHLDNIWRELVPEDRREDIDFAGKKKADKAKTLERLFNDDDFREALALDRATNKRLDAWLPEELSWPAVEANHV